nr:auxilin-like protein [Tanacetum cinerariifolium]
IKDSCKLLLHAWYLDDGIIIGDSEEVARGLDIIKLREGLFYVDIRRPSSGVKLLGGAVSRDADFISGLVKRRAANAIDLMGLLLQLHDPQSLRGSIENIVFCGGPFFRDLQWRLASLPIRFGGLGLYSAKLVSSYSFVASRDQSWVLQDHVLRDSDICAIPIDGLGQHMSPVEYHTILKYRLMVPLFLVDAISPVYRKACLDSFGEHSVHCKELPGFKYRHDMVRDVLYDIWKHACVDLSGVSSLVRLSSRGFTVGEAALKSASSKVTKHEKACIGNQHVFIPFAFDTFCFLAPEAVELLSRV